MEKKIIKFNEITIEAWKESIHKWTQCLLNNNINWHICSVCNEVDKIINGNEYCNDYCPLAPSEWCKCNSLDSKLAGYEHKSIKMSEKQKKRWIENVNNYLMWITIETEMMEEEFARSYVNVAEDTQNWGKDHQVSADAAAET
jgi:hypothetical protein